VDHAGDGKSSQARVHPVALELLVSFQQFNVRAPAVGLCLVTGSKASLVQVLPVNLNPCCQRKQTSKCCRDRVAGLPWNLAACQPPLHSKHLDYQRDLVHTYFLFTEVFWDTFLPLSSPQKAAGIFCSSSSQQDWLLLE